MEAREKVTRIESDPSDWKDDTVGHLQNMVASLRKENEELKKQLEAMKAALQYHQHSKW